MGRLEKVSTLLHFCFVFQVKAFAINNALQENVSPTSDLTDWQLDTDFDGDYTRAWDYFQDDALSGKPSGENSRKEEESSQLYSNPLMSLPNLYSTVRSSREKSVEEDDGKRKPVPFLLGNSNLHTSSRSPYSYFILPSQKHSTFLSQTLPVETLKSDSARTNKKMRVVLEKSTDHLHIKQSQFNKNGKNEELKENVGSEGSSQKSSLFNAFSATAYNSARHLEGKPVSKYDGNYVDNVMGTLRSGNEREEVMKVLSPLNPVLPYALNQFDTSTNLSPFNKKAVDLPKSLSLIKIERKDIEKVRKQGKNQRGKMRENQKSGFEKETKSSLKRSKSSSITNALYNFPPRIPFPYVSRDHNEGSYYKETGRALENTNDMTTDQRQTGKLLLQRRNRSKRNAPDSDFSREVNVKGEGEEMIIGAVKNATHPPSPATSPIEALQRLTRLLDRMLRELSQFQQKFTLRLIRMTERQDIDQMQNIMKDFEISPEKPIFFIAGGLKKVNRSSSISVSPKLQNETNGLGEMDETRQKISETLQEMGSFVPNTVIEPTISPIAVSMNKENITLPVEPEAESSTEVQGEIESDVEVTTQNIIEEEKEIIPAEKIPLSRNKRSYPQFEEIYVFPVPGRSARTENPYDDDDYWYQPIFEQEQKPMDGESSEEESSEKDIELTSSDHLILTPSLTQINQSQEEEEVANVKRAFSNMSSPVISESPIETAAAVPLPVNLEKVELVNESINILKEHQLGKSIDHSQIVIPQRFPTENIVKPNETVLTADILNHFPNGSMVSKIDIDHTEVNYSAPIKTTNLEEFQEIRPESTFGDPGSPLELPATTTSDNNGNSNNQPQVSQTPPRPVILSSSSHESIPLPTTRPLLEEQKDNLSSFVRPSEIVATASHGVSIAMMNPISKSYSDSETLPMVNETEKVSPQRNILSDIDTTPEIKKTLYMPKTANLLVPNESKQKLETIKGELITDLKTGLPIKDNNALLINNPLPLPDPNLSSVVPSDNNTTQKVTDILDIDEHTIEDSIPPKNISIDTVEANKESFDGEKAEDHAEGENIMEKVSENVEKHSNPEEEEIAKVFPNPPTFHASTTLKESQIIDNNATFLPDSTSPIVIPIHSDVHEPDIIHDSTSINVRNTMDKTPFENDISSQSLENVENSQKESVSLKDLTTSTDSSVSVVSLMSSTTEKVYPLDDKQNEFLTSHTEEVYSPDFENISGNNFTVFDKVDSAGTKKSYHEHPKVSEEIIVTDETVNDKTGVGVMSTHGVVEQDTNRRAVGDEAHFTLGPEKIESTTSGVITNDTKVNPGSEKVTTESIFPISGEQSIIPKDATEKITEIKVLPEAVILDKGNDGETSVIVNPKANPVQDSSSTPATTLDSVVTTEIATLKKQAPSTENEVKFEDKEPSSPVSAPISSEEIFPNLPDTDLDTSFGVKPIDTVPNLQIPGLRPSIPARPQPDYIQFVAQGVDVDSFYFTPPVNPVIVSSPPVFSNYSPASIVQRQHQLMNNYFSGLLFRRE